MGGAVGVAFLLGMLTLSLVPEGNSECCQAVSGGMPPFFTPDTCADGTRGTPCCGYGPCNIFCCNCDNGCRTKGREDEFGLPKENAGAARVLEKLDVNGDGKIDLGEMSAWRDSLHPQSHVLEKNITDEFVRMDLDRSGFLSANEIDEN